MIRYTAKNFVIVTALSAESHAEYLVLIYCNGIQVNKSQILLSDVKHCSTSQTILNVSPIQRMKTIEKENIFFKTETHLQSKR